MKPAAIADDKKALDQTRILAKWERERKDFPGSVTRRLRLEEYQEHRIRRVPGFLPPINFFQNQQDGVVRKKNRAEIDAQVSQIDALHTALPGAADFFMALSTLDPVLWCAEVRAFLRAAMPNMWHSNTNTWNHGGAITRLQMQQLIQFMADFRAARDTLTPRHELFTVTCIEILDGLGSTKHKLQEVQSYALSFEIEDLLMKCRDQCTWHPKKNTFS